MEGRTGKPREKCQLGLKTGLENFTKANKSNTSLTLELILGPPFYFVNRELPQSKKRVREKAYPQKTEMPLT